MSGNRERQPSSQINLQQLKEVLTDKWGSLVKPVEFSYSPQIHEFIDFNLLDRDAKIFLCEVLIRFSSPRVGYFRGSSDLRWLVASIANEIFENIGGPNRRLPPLKVAFRILSEGISDRDLYLAENALVTPYLLAEIEYQIRIQCRYLDYQGIVQRKLPKHIANNRIKSRVNQVHIAYWLLLYRNNTTLGLKLKELDKNLENYLLFSENGKQLKLRNGISGKFIRVNSVADRLNYTRNRIMHGEAPFIVSEAFFHALLLSIFFYAVHDDS